METQIAALTKQHAATEAQRGELAAQVATFAEQNEQLQQSASEVF